jgi:hypothetical protein
MEPLRERFDALFFPAFAAFTIGTDATLPRGVDDEGRSIRANVGVELKGVSWS